MKGKPGCPICGGRGVVLDPDPRKAAVVCACTREGEGDPARLGIPARYQDADLDQFWKWWIRQPARRPIDELLEETEQLLKHPETLDARLRPEFQRIVERCHRVTKASGALGWKTTTPAIEPKGWGALEAWVAKGSPRVDLWWIHGPSGSGKSTLAAASLKAWAQSQGRGGRFVSVRTLSQEVKDTYFDTRSFSNTEFRSERSQMGPLSRSPFLVLDDWDRMDSDIRVGRAFAELLARRYDEGLPTLLTASCTPEALRRSDQHPLPRMDDTALLDRLERASSVELRRSLERLRESLDAGLHTTR